MNFCNCALMSLTLPSIMALISIIILGMMLLCCIIFTTFVRVDKRVLLFSLLVLDTMIYILAFAIYTTTSCKDKVLTWKIIRYAAATMMPFFLAVFMDKALNGKVTSKCWACLAACLILLSFILFDKEHFITRKVLYFPEKGYHTAPLGPWMKFLHVAMIIMFIRIMAGVIWHYRNNKKKYFIPMLILCFAYLFNEVHDLCMNIEVVGKFHPALWLEPEIVVLTISMAVLIEYRKQNVQLNDICSENKQLSYKIVRDGLTNLYTKEYLFNYIEMNKNELEGSALIMMDMDKFKVVNDTLGHDEGDKLLAYMGSIIHLNVTKNDIAARFGGDEFFILLKDVNAYEAINIGEKIRKEYMDIVRLQHPDMHSAGHGVSVGVAAFTEKDENVISVFKRADRAMYKAKHSKKKVKIS